MARNEIRRKRSPIGEMVLYDDRVIVHTLDDGAVVNERVARQVIEDTVDLAAGTDIAVVVDLTKVAFAERSAREVFAIDPSGGVEVATALVANARVASFLAEQFVTKANPDRPTAIFEDVDVAAAWAAERVHDAG